MTNPTSGEKPALRDGARAVAQVRLRCGSDAAGLIAELERLRTSFAENPHVLHALCLAYARSGVSATALRLAQESIGVCFRSRQGVLAAEVFEALDVDARTLGVSREQLLAFGGAFAMTPRWRIAYKSLAALLVADVNDTKALRSMLRLADILVDRMQAHREAQEVLNFLSSLRLERSARLEIEQRLHALAGESLVGAD